MLRSITERGESGQGNKNAQDENKSGQHGV
jgi:hypothetical protein